MWRGDENKGKFSPINQFFFFVSKQYERIFKSNARNVFISIYSFKENDGKSINTNYELWATFPLILKRNENRFKNDNDTIIKWNYSFTKR